MRQWAVAAMVLALLCGGLLGIIFLPLHAYNLPHRPPTLNHGQGMMQEPGRCPAGTREYWLYADDGTKFFLECMR